MLLVFFVVVLCVNFSLGSVLDLENVLHETDVFFQRNRSDLEVEHFVDWQFHKLQRDSYVLRYKRDIPLKSGLTFKGVTEGFELPFKSNIKDVKICEIGDEIFTVLTFDDDTKLGIFKFVQGSFIEILQINASNLVSFEVFKWDQQLFIVMYDNLECQIYKLELNGGNLTHIQTLPTSESFLRIRTWSSYDNVYLLLISDESVKIFIWTCLIFDFIQEVPIKSLQLNCFHMGTSSFIAICEKDCSIYKFNIANEKFEWYQHLTFSSPITALSVNECENNVFLIISVGNQLVVYVNNHEGVFYPFQNFFTHKKITRISSIFSVTNICSFFCVFNKEISVFSYDGWKFEQGEITQLDEGLPYSLERLSHNFWLVLLTKQRSSMKLAKINVEAVKYFDTTNQQTLDWCEQKLNLVRHSLDESSNLANIGADVLLIKNLKVDQLQTEEFGHLNAKLVNQLNNLTKSLNKLEELYEDTLTLLTAVLQNEIIIRGPQYIANLTVNCSLKPCNGISNLDINTLNGENFDSLLENLVLIDGDAPWYLSETLIMENVSVRHIQPRLINNSDAHVLSVNEDLMFENIDVNGNLFLHGVVFVGGKVNGVLMDENHLILNGKDQTFNGDLILNYGSIKNFTLNGTINGIELNSDWMFKNGVNLKESWNKLDVDKLDLRNARISGYNVSNLFQIINEYNNLNIGQLDVEKLSNVSFADLIPIDNNESSFVLNGNLTFLNPIFVNHLIVNETINGYPLSTIALYLQEEGFNMIERSISGDELEPFDEIVEIFDSVIIDEIKAKHMLLYKELNGQSLHDLIGDLIPKNYSDIILGIKSVENLIVNDTIVDTITNADLLEDSLEIIWNGDMNLNNSLIAKDTFCNGSFYHKFMRDLLLNKSGYISADVNFTQGIFVENPIVNGINLTSLSQNSIKINEMAKLENMNMIGTVWASSITTTDGLVNGANFGASVLKKNSPNMQHVEGDYLIINKLIIDGELIINGDVHDLNLTVRACQRNAEDFLPKEMEVYGSVKMMEEPKIRRTVNKLAINELKAAIWLADQSAHFRKGNFENLVINGFTNVHGLVNNVNLTKLRKNYLSKSRPAIIKSDIVIDEIVVGNNALFNEITGGKVNGLNISDFSKSILLNNTDQTFRNKPHFKNISFAHADILSTVNGLNLSCDVLRYDVSPDKILDEKTFKSVSAQKLILSHRNLTIQGVSFLDWHSKAIRQTKGGIIKGNVTFEKIRSRTPLSVLGTVQNVSFTPENIVSSVGKHYYITGGKSFTNTVFIKELKRADLISGINIGDIMKNSMYLNDNLKVHSKLGLNNIKVGGELTVNGKLFGVNVTATWESIGNLPQINYLHDKYQALDETAKLIENDIKGSAYFLDHYRLIDKIKINASGVILLNYLTGESVLTLFEYQGRNKFYLWESSTRRFVNIESVGSKKFNLNGTYNNIQHGGVPTSDFTFLNSTKSLIIKGNKLHHLNLPNTTCVTYFGMLNDSDTCFFHGSTNNNNTIMCLKDNSAEAIATETFNEFQCIQALGILLENKAMLAVISTGSFWNKLDTVITIYSFTNDYQQTHSQMLAVINPVFITSVSYEDEIFLAVSSHHQPGSVRNSMISIFRYRNYTEQFIRYQDILLDAPGQILFAILPTRQLVLYVLSGNPSKPLSVYLYRGAEGFILETSGLILHSSSILYAFTIDDDHFLVVIASGFVQILKAEMIGLRP